MRTGDPLARLRTLAEQQQAGGVHRELRPRTLEDIGLLDVASNDYLGLTRHPSVIAGAIDAAEKWGAGSTGSRLVTGSTELHAQLEDALANFVGTQAGLVCSSGYLANLAAVVALSGPGTLIVSEQRNHASIVDACRLSRARIVITPHCDVESVDKALANRTEETAVVVTDSVFSVDGDLALIKELHAVVQQQGALLIVDEAHALGVVGSGGRGAVFAAGLAGEPDVVITATLSKSLGAQGGVVLGAAEVIAHLVNTARAFIFDTGLAPACVGAALAALEIVKDHPELATSARANARRIAAIAREAGLSVPAEPTAAVTSVLIGAPQQAIHAASTCAENGVRVGLFRPPSVPTGQSCLRLIGRADLVEGDFFKIRSALKAVTQR